MRYIILPLFLLASNFIFAQVITTYADGFNNLSDININSKNEIFVTESFSEDVLKVDASGNKTIFAATGGYSEHITFDSWDTMYVLETFLDKIFQYNPDGSNKSLLIDLHSVSALEIKDEELYYASFDTIFVLNKKDLSLQKKIFSFLGVSDLVIDFDKNIYAADRNDRKLYKIEPNGNKTVIASNVEGLNGLAIANNIVYFTMSSDFPEANKILKYDPTTNQITDYVTTGLNVPRKIAIDRLGNMYVTNRGSETIIKITDSALLPTTVFFKDQNFKDILVSNFGINSNHDSEIQITEAEAAKYVNTLLASAPEVRDMTGLEAFINIISSNCKAEKIKIIDFSHNTKLEKIWVSGKLDSIILPVTTTLKKLNVSSNNLTNIDLSGVPNIEELQFQLNKFTSIDISNLSKLKTLLLFHNNISNIDVSSCPNLEELGISENKLTTIDVSQNLELKILNVGRNQLPTIDFSQNTKLKGLYCYKNLLQSIDVSNNPKIANLDYSENEDIQIIGLHTLSKLDYLQCQKTNSQNLDVTNNPLLRSLNCSFNKYSSLDLSQNPLLKDLNITYSDLIELDLTHNDSLKYFACGTMLKLESLDLRSGSNENLNPISITIAPLLKCIFVDNVTYSETNWTGVVTGHFVETDEACNQLTNTTDPENILNLRSFPNPIIDFVNFKSDLGIEHIDIYNKLGQLIVRKSNSTRLNLSTLPAGLYVAKIQFTHGTTKTLKLIKGQN